jgi:hypothetical protein
MRATMRIEINPSLLYVQLNGNRTRSVIRKP